LYRVQLNWSYQFDFKLLLNQILLRYAGKKIMGIRFLIYAERSKMFNLYN